MDRVRRLGVRIKLKRMSYDHARKAGNRGDVWKHFTLVTVADSLVATDRFRYVDTHSGAPCYQLGPTGEWKLGIGKVLAECGSLLPHSYFEVASSFVRNHTYPSGWWFVANRLSARCQHVEVALTDEAQLVAVRYEVSSLPDIPANVTFCFNQEDGFRRLESVNNADLVLVDPPYSPDAAADWERTALACRSLMERHIPFLVWYPVFWHTKPKRLVTDTGCSAWKLTWAQISPKPSQNLKGCGVLASPGLNEILQGAARSFEALASCLGGTFQIRSFEG